MPLVYIDPPPPSLSARVGKSAAPFSHSSSLFLEPSYRHESPLHRGRSVPLERFYRGASTKGIPDESHVRRARLPRSLLLTHTHTAAGQKVSLSFHCSHFALSNQYLFIFPPIFPRVDLHTHTDSIMKTCALVIYRVDIPADAPSSHLQK